MRLVTKVNPAGSYWIGKRLPLSRSSSSVSSLIVVPTPRPTL